MSSYKNNKHTDMFTEYYSENDNYQKVLFNPGKVLQAQELHNMQTYNTNQIAIQSDTLYKSGSIVTSNYITFSNNYFLLEVDKFYDDVYNKTYVSGNISIKTTYSYEFNNKYYIIFSNLSDLFTISDPITFTNTSDSKDTIIASKIYRGLLISNSDDGYIYYAGYYLNVKKSDKPVLVDIYLDNTSIISGNAYKDITYYFGFKISENYVSSKEDENLVDYVSTTNNYKAPGNNRLQYATELAGYTEEPEDNFVNILVVKNGTIIKENKAGISGDVLDYLEQRTYEESGSYTVNPWKINCTDNEEDSTKYDINIEPGSGYIYGKKIQTIVSTPITVTKNIKSKLYQKERLHIDTLGDYFYAKIEDQMGTKPKVNGSVTIRYSYGTDKTSGKIGTNIYFQPSSGTPDSQFVTNKDDAEGTWIIYSPDKDNTRSTEIYVKNTYDPNYTYAETKNLYTKTSKSYEFNALEGDYIFSFQEYEPVRVFNKPIEDLKNKTELDIISAEIIPDEHKNLLKAAYYKEQNKAVTYNNTLYRYCTINKIDTTSWDTIISALQNKIIESYVKKGDVISPELLEEYQNVNLKWHQYSLRDVRPVIFNISRTENIFKIYLLNTSYIRKNYANAESISNIYEVKGINLFNNPMPVFYQGSDTLIIKSEKKYICNDSSNKIKGIYTHQYTGVAKDKSLKIYVSRNQKHVRFIEYKWDDTAGKYKESGQTYESNEIKYTNNELPFEISNITYIDSFGNIYPAEFLTTSITDSDLDNSLEPIYLYNLDNNNYLNINDYTSTVNKDAVGIYIEVTSDKLEDNKNYLIAVNFINTLDTTQKTLKTNTVTKDISDFIVLDHCDIFSIDSIVINNEEIDSSKYLFDNGQRNWIYSYGNIQNLAKLTGINSGTVTITYKYYDRVGTSPCTAGSYSSTDYSNILSYSGYNLRDCIDLRRTLKSTCDYVYDIGEEDTSKQRTLTCDNDFIFWYNMYLPHYDSVYISKDGNFGVHSGVASLEPELLPEQKGEMNIYYLYCNPYIYNVKDDITLKYVNNQRYTMKQINRLDERIENIENSAALNQLEQSVVNMQITDSNGLDRYKTGIFTDSFTSYDNSNYTDSEYNCCIDKEVCAIRAPFKDNQITFYLNEDKSETQKHGYTLTHNIEKIETYAKNEYASTTYNVQGLMFYVWTGNITLSPAVDTWVTDLGKVETVKYIETEQPPTEYRYWSNSKTITKTETVYVKGMHVFTGNNKNWVWQTWNPPASYYNTTATITTSLGATITLPAFQNYHTMYEGGGTWINVTSSKTTTTTYTETTNYVGSWQEQSSTTTAMEKQDEFMRQIVVTVECKSFQPYAKFRAFLDTREVICYTDSNLTSPINTIPQNGRFKMYFKVPANMTVGTKLFKIVEYNNTDTVMGSTEYTAHGKTIWVNVEKSYLRVWTAVKTTVSTTTTSTGGANANSGKTDDPLAETFTIGDVPIYLDSIDVFFAAKDPDVSVNLYIVETENGYPGSDILAGSQVTLSPTDIATNRYGKYLKGTSIPGNSTCRTIVENETVDNSNWDGNGDFMAVQVTPTSTLTNMKQKVLAPTRFTFPEPLYLQANKEYAFIVSTGSYKYEMYCSKLGDVDLVSNQLIKEQPYSGCMFRSQNARTWTAEQDCDLTFRLNRCVFETGQKNTYFNLNYSEENGTFFTDLQNISVNLNCPTSTSCDLYYTFSELDIDWMPFENGQDIANDKRYLITNPQSIRLKLVTNTSTNYVSPQIDLEQVYGIFTYNDLKLVKTKVNGVVTEEQEYSLDTKPTVFNSSNTYDTIYECYHAGTYISNTVKLENESEDLRVLVSAYEQYDSNIHVYFQTHNINLKMIYHNQDCLCGFDKDIDISTEVNQLQYSYNYDSITDTFTKSNIQCKLSGYRVTEISAKTAKIYFGELSYNIPENTTLIFANSKYDLVNSYKGVWEAKSYIYGDIVQYNNKLWSAKETTTSINVPSELSVMWELIKGFSVTGPVIESDNDNWQEMVIINDSISFNANTGYTELTYRPKLEIMKSFTDFKIKIEMYSQDEINIPYVKALRAIAVI